MLLHSACAWPLVANCSSSFVDLPNSHTNPANCCSKTENKTVGIKADDFSVGNAEGRKTEFRKGNLSDVEEPLKKQTYRIDFEQSAQVGCVEFWERLVPTTKHVGVETFQQFAKSCVIVKCETDVSQTAAQSHLVKVFRFAEIVLTGFAIQIFLQIEKIRTSARENFARHSV